MDDMIAWCKASSVDGMEYFLKTFSFVPDDKLTWTETPTSKSAIRIAAHTALYAGIFAGMIKDGKHPGSGNFSQWQAERDVAEAAITSRAEIEVIFRKGTEEVIAALDSLTPERIGLNTDSGFGCSMTDLINQPGMHAMSHAAQIDYLQTCWDDHEVHI